jgi:very-short-patch-repair endonuclease
MNKYPIEGARDRSRALRREMTEAERHAWRILRSRQIDGYRFRQVPLGRYIADFVCHESMSYCRSRRRHDPLSALQTERTRFLRDEGYRVLRLWNHEVLANPEGVHGTIIEHLRRQHPHPTPSMGEGLKSLRIFCRTGALLTKL